LNVSFDWLVTVMSVMCSGKIDKTGKISMRRFMEVLRVLKVGLTPLEVSEIGNILHSFDESDNKLIYYYNFLASIKALLSIMEEVPEESRSEKALDEHVAEKFKEDVEFSSPLQKKTKRLQEEEKKESPVEASSNTRNRASVDNESVMKDKEINFHLPELDEHWCEGDFSIVINRCHQCHFHKEYSRHYEAVLISY